MKLELALEMLIGITTNGVRIKRAFLKDLLDYAKEHFGKDWLEENEKGLLEVIDEGNPVKVREFIITTLGGQADG